MSQWVINSPDLAPAFVLANAGYDVWLGNNRGTVFGQKHVSKDSKSKEFWDFTWEEMGTNDLPAFIDKILAETGASRVNYMAHSEGTTQLLAGASLKPNYFNTKINLATLLAPVASAAYVSQPIFRFFS